MSSPAIADLDNDGKLEIVISAGVASPPRIYILNGEDGTVLLDISNEEAGYATPSIGDVDNDGWLEIATGGSGPLIIIDGNCPSDVEEERGIKEEEVFLTPNPFYHNVTFKYTLNTRAYVSIKLYNIVGELIETLVEKVEIPGIHTLQWEPKIQSSSIYFVKIRIDDNQSTYKLVRIYDKKD
jgi:hypothetical protein